MIIGHARILDAIDTLQMAGVRRLIVTPEFYVGFARYVARGIEKRRDTIGLPFLEREKIHLAYQTSDEIVDERLGDTFYYRGVTVRLEKDSTYLP